MIFFKKKKKKCDCWFEVFDVSEEKINITAQEEITITKVKYVTNLLLRCFFCGNYLQHTLDGKWDKEKLMKLTGKPNKLNFFNVAKL